MLRRGLTNVLSNYVTKLVSLATWFLLTPFILNKLGATDYGLWVLIGSVVSYGSVLELGIAGAVTKYVAEYTARGEPARAQSLIATVLRIYTVLGVVAFGLSVAAAPAFPQIFQVPPEGRWTASNLVLIMGLAVGISIPSTITTAILWGLQRYDVYNALSVGGSLLTAVASVAVLLLGGGVIGMVAVTIPITLTMQVLAIWCIRRLGPELQFGWSGGEWQHVRPIVSFSWALFVTLLAGRLQTKTDEIVIGVFLPVSAVTPYALARKLSELPQVLTNQFMKILPPMASELDAVDDRARLRSLYVFGTRVTLATFVPLACILIVLARPILGLWVGSDYADSEVLVVILTLAGLIATSQWPAELILQGMDRHRPLAWMSSCSAIANVLLSIVLLGQLGLVGVALGTLLPTTAVSLGLILPYSMRTIGISASCGLRQIFLPVLAPALPTVLTLVVSQQLVRPDSTIPILSVAMLAIVVYLAVYATLGASHVERQLYRRALFTALRSLLTYLRNRELAARTRSKTQM